MPRIRGCGFVAVFVCLQGAQTFAHEIRPAYLELHEEASGEFHVLWKTPMRGDLRLSLRPEFSGPTENLSPVTTRRLNDAAVQRWTLRAVEPLRGRSVRIAGLEGTMTDALVRVTFADGATWTQRLTPAHPSATIPERVTLLTTASTYLLLGVEHILLGVDHLLFVLALLILTHRGWKLVKTVTAFTIAHSITLGLATLGLVHVPSAPVEAIIALSIVYVAAEIVYARRGVQGITARAPWIAAFAFGLLHGFGFAGALSEVGLPQGHIPLALLFFNLGVEAGQLIFVGAVIAFVRLIQRLRVQIPRGAELVPPYAIGSVAMFWVIQRVSTFFT